MEHNPCQNQSECPLKDTMRSCFEDTHHLYYPKAEYTTPTEKRFRELDANKILGCRALHNLRHYTENPPKKPSVQEMNEAIQAQKEAT